MSEHRTIEQQPCDVPDCTGHHPPEQRASNPVLDPTNWIAYLEADPRSEPYLSIAAAWRRDKAEIERLTAELQGTKDELHSVDKAAKELGAERDRLRAALEGMAQFPCASANMGPGDCGSCFPCSARKALAGAADETSDVRVTTVGFSKATSSTALAHPHACKDGVIAYLTYGMTCGNCGYKLL